MEILCLGIFLKGMNSSLVMQVSNLFVICHQRILYKLITTIDKNLFFFPSWLEKGIQYGHWFFYPPKLSAKNEICLNSITMSNAWSDWQNLHGYTDILSLNPAQWFEDTKILAYSCIHNSFPNTLISWSTFTLLLLQYKFLREKYTLSLPLYLEA